MNAIKAAAVLFFWVFIPSAFAEWQKNANAGGVTFYYDLDSIQWKNRKVTVIELYDHQSPRHLPNNAAYRSQKLTKEYDCETSSHRIQSLQTFDGNMLTGQSTEMSQVQAWAPVKPDTYSDYLLKTLCKP